MKGLELTPRRKTRDEILQTGKSAVWGWYSVDQYKALNLFCNKCTELEEKGPEPPPSFAGLILEPWEREDHIAHRSYVMATVMSSVAFLEASLNELFASAGDDSLRVGGGRGSLTERERHSLCAVWGIIERAPLLDKCQLVLDLLGREPFNSGGSPYQDTYLLVKLRDLLVHSKPGWTTHGDPDSGLLKSLGSLAVERNFNPHPFADDSSPFFPDRLLGADCAHWARKTAIGFANEFFDRLGVKPAYAQKWIRRRRRDIVYPEAADDFTSPEG